MVAVTGEEGGCLCRGIRYRIDGEMRDVINCFCDQCKKTSGHHVAATQVQNSNLILLSGQTLRWYRSSDSAERGFCNTCGGNVFWRPFNKDSMSVMAGTLDRPVGLKTAENMCAAQKADYHALPLLTNN